MKKFAPIILIFLAITSCQPQQNQDVSTSKQLIDTAGVTNNFYDNEPVKELALQNLTVEGEISNPFTVDFSKLPTHSVIVKETKLNPDGTNAFVGAYRYDGYSLFDVLNEAKIQKKNFAEFPPIIDLYVEITNSKGEKVVISWGEIYYPNNLHGIIIAKSVMRIVPSKTKELWPLTDSSKLIVGADLLTERNITNPTRITIRSADPIFKVQKGMSPMFCDNVKFTDDYGKEVVLKNIPKGLNQLNYNTIFYGRGRGIHSTSPFIGYELKQVIAPYFLLDAAKLQKGLFVFAGLDGYRVAITYAELFNRNDQSEFLLVYNPNDHDGGIFRLFPAPDFFSDRAVKSLSEIRFEKR